MKRREKWRPVLDAEVKRWAEKSYDQLRAELKEIQNYEIEFASKLYQVEVQLIKNTEDYVHVSIGVDDGSLPWSIFPLSTSIIQRRPA